LRACSVRWCQLLRTELRALIELGIIPCL
jgi:hypothetical protein